MGRKEATLFIVIPQHHSPLGSILLIMLNDAEIVVLDADYKVGVG